MKASEWRAERNARAEKRLRAALPEIFPQPVLVFALSRPFTPPTPRLAIDGYWRNHPVRADRLARALARRSGAPAGWTWRVSAKAAEGGAMTFRLPPAPYREKAFAAKPGACCICGQPVYRFGWHADLWNAGPNRNARWHAACVQAWRLWIAPRDHLKLLKRLQKHRCAQSGARIWKTAEVDHRVPLFQVWREREAHAWADLLGFWSVRNLQVINRDAHVEKCEAERVSRAAARSIALSP